MLSLAACVGVHHYAGRNEAHSIVYIVLRLECCPGFMCDVYVAFIVVISTDRSGTAPRREIGGCWIVSQ